MKGKTKKIPEDKMLSSGRFQIGTFWNSLFIISSKRLKGLLPDERTDHNLPPDSGSSL